MYRDQDARLQARLRRLEKAEVALAGTRRKRQQVLTNQMLVQHPTYAELARRRKALRHELHQHHLNIPRKRKAAASANQRAAEYLHEAMLLEAEERVTRTQLSDVEGQIESLRQRLFDEVSASGSRTPAAPREKTH